MSVSKEPIFYHQNPWEPGGGLKTDLNARWSFQVEISHHENIFKKNVCKIQHNMQQYAWNRLCFVFVDCINTGFTNVFFPTTVNEQTKKARQW